MCRKSTEDNIEAYEEVKIEYKSLYDYLTQGNVVCSRANWHEKGEKNNRYFLKPWKKQAEKDLYEKISGQTRQRNYIE